MTEDLQDLYQQVILDHSQRPRNYGPALAASHSGEGYNPLCGDHYTIHVRTDGNVLSMVTFEGSGCAISKAAASIMTTVVQGRSAEETSRLFAEFQKLITTGDADAEALGKLAAFAGVHKFPSRVKCAALPWHALRAALGNSAGPVSTERADATARADLLPEPRR